jgi:hypothetical protein
MTYIQYPVFKKIPTKFGPVNLAFTQGSHVHVADSRHGDYSGETEPFTYRGKPYYLSVHLFADVQWGEKDPSAFEISRADAYGKYVAPTYRTAIVAELTRVVTEFIGENPDVLREAEYADANNVAGHLSDKIDEMEQKLEILRAQNRAALERRDENRPEGK